MKINVVVSALPPLLDGIGDYTAHLVEGLASAVHVRVLTTCQHPVDSIRDVDVVPAFAPSQRRSVLKLAKTVARHQPDWVILQFNQFSFGRWGLNPFLPMAIRRIGKNSPEIGIAVMFHEDFVPRINWKFAIMRVWQEWQFNQLGKLAHVVLFSIDPWIHKYQSRFPGKPVCHLPVGSNVPRIRITREQARSRLNIPDEKIVLGLFGAVHRARNTPWLIAALRCESKIECGCDDRVHRSR